MKILHVITSLHTGGAEKLMVDLLPRLREFGHEVELCLFNGEQTTFYKQLEKENIKIHCLGTKRDYYNIKHCFQLLKLMRGFDLVHTHDTAPQLFAAVGSLLCSVVLCTTEHNTSNRRRKWKWYAWIDRWMYKRYWKVICISNQAEKNLRDYLPSLKNICTVFNGVDIKQFNAAHPVEAYKSSKVVVVMVAGFRYQKDQDTLIKSFSHLDKDKYELWLIGDGERRNLLEGLVDNLGLRENVKFWGIRNDIPQLLQTADIVVMSSHFEGLSLSNIEGMSVNKPFIASDVDGLREVVDGYGLLFPHSDDVALAAIIKTLSEDKELYQKVAKKCWERAQMYDIDKMALSYNDIYQSLEKR